jgi:hypothetical protein
MKRGMGVLLAAVGQVALSGAVDKAFAAPPDSDTARIEALEKEIAQLRRENAALRKGPGPDTRTAAPRERRQTQEPSPPLDPRAAYATAAPTGPVLKSSPGLPRGEFRGWIEGGGFWTGGEPVYSFFDNATPFLSGGSTLPSFFTLKPNFGWNAAAGFDYRFAGSPWHVSAQFRYGQAGTSEGTAFNASATNPPIFVNPPAVFASIAQNIAAEQKESHWLADVAVGRDVLGSGLDAMQLKFGVRIAHVTAKASTRENTTLFVDFGAPVVLSACGCTVTSVSEISNEVEVHKSRFLGAGPRIGVEGAAPLGRGWSFDYLADASVLFGTQRFELINTGETVVVDQSGTTIISIPRPPGVGTQSKGATVFNADIQAGVSYWINPNIKFSASYRLDAFFGVLSTFDVKHQFDQPTKIDRYFHGPQIAVSGRF